MRPAFKSWVQRLAGPLMVLLAAAVAMTPIFLRGASRGADLYFHLASWIEARHSMFLAIPYPHWAPASNFGAGEPRFVFYPPLTWMTGALLGIFFPWDRVAVVFGFLLLAGMGLATRALALEVMADGPATLAGCTAIFTGYALFEVYRICDFAELTGGIWIPLLLLFLLRDRNSDGGFWKRAFDGSAAPLALIVAGVWLSNGPLGLMTSYMLPALAVAAAIAVRSWTPLVRATASFVLGLGLAADYLVPAFSERSWANLQSAISIPHFWVQNNLLFSRYTDPSLVELAAREKLITFSWLAVAMFAAAVGGALVAWMRGTLPGPRRWWITLLTIPFLVLFIMLPVSLPVWDHLPLLRYLQFSWRWLEFMAAPAAIFFASAVWFAPLRKRVAVLAVCAVFFIAFSSAAGRYWFAEGAQDQKLIVAAEQTGTGVHWKPEYAPPGTHYEEADPLQPGACLIDDPSILWRKDHINGLLLWDSNKAECRPFVALLYLPESKHIVGEADHAGYLIVKVRSYPAWKVTLNGQPVFTAVEGAHGLIAVPVAKGHVDVRINWTETPDVIAGRWISAIALGVVTGLCLLERRLSRPRL